MRGSKRQAKEAKQIMHVAARNLAARSLALIGAALALGACATSPAATSPAPHTPPIVFVHGNGDTAALWLTTLWRFESNGWPRERLHAIDLPYPLARDADDKAQAGRTSTTEHRDFLAAEIDKVLKATGAKQVVLVGNSRGGYGIRNYVMNGGAAKVSHAVLGGTPNHGVWADAAGRPMSEFNGAGPFLAGLNNQGAAGVEITPGPKWMTVRSDNNDKFAQPDGVWIGAKGTPTNVTFAGPELKGASNVVIPGIDHRETSFSPQAFAATYRFITGHEPSTTAAVPEAKVLLNGKVSGQGLNNDPNTGTFVNNLALAGATVEVFAVDGKTGERQGTALWSRTTTSDGMWGPFTAQPNTAYEFVLRAPGYAISHHYRSPFARSSNIVHLRAERLAEADKAAGSVVTFTRPRGYFGLPRDTVVFDGANPAPGVPRGVAGVSTSKLRLPVGAQRAVAAQFNQHSLVGRTWPAAENRVVFLELHD
jgi:triacylglycerol lipase